MTVEDTASVAEESVVDRLDRLERSNRQMRDELEIRRLLAWYGFYVDHGLHDEWAGLFTHDASIDITMYHGDDPSNMDPDLFRPTVYAGREEIIKVVRSPAMVAMAGRTQHHMDGQPAIIDFESDDVAVATAYAVLYIVADSPDRTVAQQILTVSRLQFVKSDGEWFIRRCVRRRLGADTLPLLPDLRR
ncbi:MAG TPA: nuclear transport factor 2 family protein [Solirubrobacteraceae bacterium]|nr:nuclear transport factor 2 family protein [Solirubrobacteraceae bacterium]